MTQSKSVVFCMDAFKGTLSSYRGGEAAEMGFRAFQEKCANVPATSKTTKEGRCMATPTTPLQFIHCPMSDGGAGLIDTLCYHPTAEPTSQSGEGTTTKKATAAHFERIYVPPQCPMTGPLGNPLVEEQRRMSLVLNKKQQEDGKEIDLNEAVSFACDVEHRVVVIEMAQASGLPRIEKPSQRSPLHTTSYGTGEMIQYAVRYLQERLEKQQGDRAVADCGVRVFVGIGGSATNDGGLGALQALGLRIYVTDDAISPDSHSDHSGKEKLLTRPFTGADLARLTRVEMSAEMRAMFCTPANVSSSRAYVSELNLICDVNNPLVGPRGATFVFGPQKCAPVPKGTQKHDAEDAPVGEVGSDAQMEMLKGIERGMAQAAERVVQSLWCEPVKAPRQASKETQLHDLLHTAGNGGAGGMSGFFRYVLQAAWLPGADAVAELLGMRHEKIDGVEEELKGAKALQLAAKKGLLYSNCDIVVSGEGSFDSQTIYSRKTVGRLLEMAVEANLWKLEQYHHLHPTVDLMQTKATGGTTTTPALIADFVIICGRCGFKSMQSCQADVLNVLRERLLPTTSAALKDEKVDASMRALQAKLQSLAVSFSRNESKRTYTAAAVLQRAVPRVTVLPLSPVAFTVKQAMTDTYNCVRKRTEACLTEEWCGDNKAAGAAAGLAWTQPSKL